MAVYEKCALKAIKTAPVRPNFQVINYTIEVYLLAQFGRGLLATSVEGTQRPLFAY